MTRHPVTLRMRTVVVVILFLCAAVSLIPCSFASYTAPHHYPFPEVYADDDDTGDFDTGGWEDDGWKYGQDEFSGEDNYGSVDDLQFGDEDEKRDEDDDDRNDAEHNSLVNLLAQHDWHASHQGHHHYEHMNKQRRGDAIYNRNNGELMADEEREVKRETDDIEEDEEEYDTDYGCHELDFTNATIPTVEDFDPVKERDALMAIYDATDGKHWQGNSSDKRWGTGWPCDLKKAKYFEEQEIPLPSVTMPFGASYIYWNGIYCYAEPGQTDGNGTVAGLYAGSFGLDGKLPDVFEAFPNLRWMIMNVNSLRGRIPPSIAYLHHLAYLDFSHNGFTSIPVKFQPYCHLIYLGLMSNRLEKLPRSLVNCQILETVSLAYNEIESVTDVVPNCVTVLYAIGNKIKKLFGGGDCDRLQNMTAIDMRYNPLGHISPSLQRMPSLQWVEFGWGQLSGHIDEYEFFSNMSSLRGLGLAANEITGPFPAWTRRLKNIERLDFSDNQMGGPIQPDFFKPCDTIVCESPFRILSFVNISNNQFTGGLPPTLSAVQNLLVLDLSHNKFTGGLSEFGTDSFDYLFPTFGGMINLLALDISHNEMSGDMPSILPVRRLQYMDMSHNYFTGELPKGTQETSFLSHLDMSHNFLSGSLPKTIYRTPSMQNFDISYNRIHGTIEKQVGALAKLSKFDVSHNRMSGPVTPYFSRTNINKFLINNNKFGGFLPLTVTSYCEEYGTHKIDTSDNRFLCFDPIGYECGRKTECERNWTFVVWVLAIIALVLFLTIPLLVYFVHWLAPRMWKALARCVASNKYHKLDEYGMTQSQDIPRLFKKKRQLSYWLGVVCVLEGFASITLSVCGIYVWSAGIDYFLGLFITLTFQPVYLITRSVVGFFGASWYHRKMTVIYILSIYPWVILYVYWLLPGVLRSNNIYNIIFYVLIALFLAFQVFGVFVAIRLHMLIRISDDLFKVSSHIGDLHSWNNPDFPHGFIEESRASDDVVNGQRIKKEELGEAIKAIKKAPWYIWGDDVLLLEKIGSGAFGEVYIASWRGTLVAAKKMHVWYEQLNDDAMLEFLDEMELMSHLRHPNVVQFLGSSLEPPDHLIVTEHVSRGSLFDVLRDKLLVLDWGIRVKMALDCAKGMAYLHKQTPYPIIHRDLKSQNLLVTSSFGVKVADFGLARHTADNNTAAMTMQVGTPIWTAPEVLRSTQYSVKADVYSFGIVMWEILTRGTPYPNLNQFELIMRVVEGARPDVPEGCPKAWRAVMESAWDASPERRPSFLELIPQLEAMLVDAASSFPPPLNVYDDEEELRSNRQQRYVSTAVGDGGKETATVTGTKASARKSRYVPPPISAGSLIDSAPPSSTSSSESSSEGSSSTQQRQRQQQRSRGLEPPTAMGYVPPSLDGPVAAKYSSWSGSGVQSDIDRGDHGSEGIDKPVIVKTSLGPRKRSR
eukprot:TRINITY_DN1784_c0_g1_i1.p1 TRINITY_DN1784_c0_g1~~TRINITY_DN1784_c0_g1_i1.p1  ORF type:complete len:1436 (-),score=219.60 TRINITY_DN1784_c0_g1_i1:255-4562(-)